MRRVTVPMEPVPYLKATDPEAFLDMPVLEDPSTGRFKESMPGPWKHCPTCLGHGGWHLRLHAYGHDKHFDCSCADCHGWGWIKADMVELPTQRFARIQAKFKPVLVYDEGSFNTVGRRGGCYRLTDPALRADTELKEALIYCADGWWPHNFGGKVVSLGEDRYAVDVYID